MKKIERSVFLDRKTIDEISDGIGDFLSANKADELIIIQVRNVIEEFLLELYDEVGENEHLKLKLTCTKRVGKLWIVIAYPGRRFNQTGNKTMDDCSNILLESMRIKPVITHVMGVNRLTVTVPRSGDNKERVFVAAVLLAVLTGCLGGLIPEGIRSFLSTYILIPITDIFMKFLAVIAPVLIFLGLILSIVQNGGTDSQKIRKYIVRRYITASIVLTVLSTILLIPFFRYQFGPERQSLGSSAAALYQMILDLIPGNLIQPFVDGSMPQIIILAALFGAVIRNLDNRVERLNATMDDLYTVFLNAVDYGCNVLPVFIFSSLTALLWTNGSGVILQLWKPVLALIAVYLAFILGYAVYVCVKYRVSISVLIKKILPSTLIGLTTASSMAAFTRINEVNEKLGLHKSYTDFSVPIGMQLYCGAASAVFISIAYYLAEVFRTPVEPGWFVIAGIISLIVSLATPPVSGGTMICLNIMMTSLGIPLEGLAIASTLALLSDFISTGSYIAMRHMEMVIQAGHLNMLDVGILRSGDTGK